MVLINLSNEQLYHVPIHELWFLLAWVQARCTTDFGQSLCIFYGVLLKDKFWFDALVAQDGFEVH